MCGICCILSTSSQARASLHRKQLLPNLKKRGPDLSAAIENRVLCTRSYNKQGCCSQVRQSVCGGSDVNRQSESSFTEPDELNSSDSSEDDLHNVWTKVEGQEKENTCSLTGQRNDIPTIRDGSDESRSKTNVDPADFEEESICRGCGEKLQPHCGCQSVCGSFFGQVLHLRGDPTPQPVQDEEGNILLWNGEIFDGIEVNGQNDTMVLSELLGGAKTGGDVVKVMGAIRGPWSFIYWQERYSRLWFGRDFFGRRSLLWLGDLSGPTMTFALSSVAHKTESAIPVALDWQEVPACGIFCLNVSSWGLATPKERYSEITWYPWQQPWLEHTVAPSSLRPGMNQDSTNTDPTLPSGNQAVATSKEKSSMSLFDDILQCVLGECHLGNPISPLNMHIPDQTATSSCDSEARGGERTWERSGERSGERTGDRDGEGVLHVSREVQEKAEELIRVLGEAVRKRVTNVPVRTMALQNNRALPFQDQHGNRTPLDDRLKPCLLDRGVSCCEGEGDCEAAHRKEVERTNSKHENHLEGGFLDDVERGQIKPGHDASFHSLPTDPFHRCHDNHPVLSSYSSSFSNDRCQSAASESGTTDAPGVVSGMHAGNVCEQDGDLSCTTPSSSVVCCPHGRQEDTESSRVGVLFSGGLDSIVLAALADRYMPAGEPIDLFNVAFEQRTVAEQTKGKYKKKNSHELQKKSFDVPDRLTGRAGLGELQTLNPSRKWNFVEIDVTLEELQALRSEHLCHLIYPQDTVLDDSIGCAIWFAARGRGKLVTHNPLQGELLEEPYTSPAKVVLVGMGADEQLAGYSRHRSKFKSEGWQGLLEEIEMEVDRISARNLGRDDRVISDHGRESRLPYLDEDVVSFLNSLPIHLKADLNLPRGVGEKLLLRVAAQHLGLGASSKLPKRAIQFGSRIAKLENNREKASDRCNRLEHKVD